MKRKILSILLITLLLCMSIPMSSYADDMATFYVNAVSGNDETGTGAYAYPFRTLEKAKEELPYNPGTQQYSGTIILSSDLTLSGQIQVPENTILILDLNGHVITGNESGGNDYSMFDIKKNGVMVLNDSGENGAIQGAEDDKHVRAIHVSPGGTFNMSGGRITASLADSNDTSMIGAGVCVEGNATDIGSFNMEGGSIENCMSVYQGTGDGGKGAGVGVVGGTFNMYSGKITGCNAQGFGGGVHVESGVFTMRNESEISGNFATYGGGVSVGPQGNAMMYDGKITANTATFSAGVDIKGKFNMQGGEITNNTAPIFMPGPGIRVESREGLVLSGNVKISGNTGWADINTCEEGIAIFSIDEVPQPLTVTDGPISVYMSTPGNFTTNIGADHLEDFTISSNSNNAGWKVVASLDGTQLLTTKQNNITANEAENGGISTDLDKAYYGDTVNVTATPNEGYKLKSLSYSITSDDSTPIENVEGQYKFRMPNKAVKISAEFEVAPAGGNSEEPAAPSGDVTPTGPSTGDTNMSMTWISILIISALVVLSVLALRSRLFTQNDAEE